MSEPPGGEDLPTWDDLATWWRTTFTNGVDIEYEMQILPLAVDLLRGSARVLDVGTGEGQLARRLAGMVPAPYLVAGVDPAGRQLANATEQAGGPAYLRGTGECLPFPDSSFDAVVCCLVIEHASEPEAVLREIARVLARRGRFLLIVNHPVVQGLGSGLVDDTILDERYWRIGPYLDEVLIVEEVDKGIKVSFAHRPLSRYINTLAEEGLCLTRMEEPAPPFEFLTGSVDLDLERSMPRLCAMVFERH
ncbi:MAG: class I SAM-dependent methyltransferase [Acidimicrobiales bacterium]